ncbi:hypothetical protein ACEPAG_4660 [Sanghuangporus baumii]
MSAFQDRSSVALNSAKESHEIHVKSIEVKFKKSRKRKRAVIIHLVIGESKPYISDPFAKLDDIVWDVGSKFPSTLTLAIIVQEQHTIRLRPNKNVFNVCVPANEMIMKPLIIIEEGDIAMNIHCETAGPLVELVRELVEESQNRLAEMKVFLDELGAVCERLNFVIGIIDPLAEAHPVVKVVVEVVKTLYEAYKKRSECNEAAIGLMRDIKSFFPFTKIRAERLKSDITEQAVSSLLETFARIANSIIRYSSETTLGNLLDDHTDEVNESKEEFKRLKETFDWCVKTEIWRTVLEIENDTRSMHLDKLHPVTQSFYDTKKSCYEGTREETLQAIRQWSTSESGLFWLHGAEGSGKSAIAHTIAEHLDEQNRLAGCFFCDADDPACRNPAYIVPTIAYQLAKLHEDYCDIILGILRGSDERKIHTSLDQQFTLLLDRPLKRLSRCDHPERLPPVHRPLIIVLDSPERCVNSVPEWHHLVKYLRDIGNLVPWLKIFISSRNLPHPNLLSGCNYQELDISHPDIDAHHDITIFLDYYRAEGYKLTSEGSHFLEHKAVSLSSRILIAVQILSTWMGHYVSSIQSNTSGQSWMDEIFRAAIFGIMFLRGCQEEMILIVRDILVAAASPAVFNSTIEEVLLFVRFTQGNVSLDALDATIASLSPIVLKEEAGRIRFILAPAEFLCFISDTQRSGPLWVDVNTSIAQFCLATVHSDLRFNICGLDTDRLADSDLGDLELRIETNISRILRRFSLSWMDLIVASGGSRDFASWASQFLYSEKKLYWIEVLSLIGGLQAGKKILLECASFFKDEDTIVHATTELLDFISVFEPVMVSNPFHIYTSAFAWLPSDSLIRSGIRPRVPTIVFESLPKPVSDVLAIDSAYIVCFARSPDGNRLVSGSKDGRLGIWDGLTGARIGEEIKGHTDYVIDVRSSPDGTRFVSGSADETVKIWDFTGKLVTKMESGSVVEAVAFSADGRRVVSGHVDGTLQIWDAQNGDLIAKWQGHGDCVFAVAYFPDGTRIVSGSWDNTVRMWDAQSGAAVGKPLKGHEEWVCAVAYSSDGSRIVSGSRDATVRIWDAHTGNQIGEPLKGHERWVVDVGYSQDGSRIISASLDNTVRFWNATNGDSVGVLRRGESRWDSEKQHFVSIPHWWPASRWKSFTTQSLVYSSNPLYVPEDGWIRTLDGGLLLWVPPGHRRCSCHAAGESTITTNDCDERLQTSAWKDVPQGTDWATMMNIGESD